MKGEDYYFRSPFYLLLIIYLAQAILPLIFNFACSPYKQFFKFAFLILKFYLCKTFNY